LPRKAKNPVCQTGRAKPGDAVKKTLKVRRPTLNAESLRQLHSMSDIRRMLAIYRSSTLATPKLLA
jgi:hypothetical protein